MKVMIVGGTGTISSGIANESVAVGYETYAYTRGNKKHRNVDGVNYIYGDVWDDEDFQQKIGNLCFEIVVDCLVYNIQQLKKSLRKWESRCNHYFFVSTAGIYSRNCNRRITEDDDKQLYDWEYTKNKIECEDYLIEYAKKKGLSYTIIRPTVTYGDYRIPYPVVSRSNPKTFFKRIYDRKPILSCCEKKISFSIIHIDDFSRAVVGLFDKDKAHNEAFHISYDGLEYDWDDIIRAISSILNIKVNIIHIPVDQYKDTFYYMYDEFKWNKSESLILSDKKLRKVLPDFCPQISLEEGLVRMISQLDDTMDSSYMQEDFYWQGCCDSTLYHSLQQKRIIESETEYVERYFGEMNKRSIMAIKYNTIKLIAKSHVKKIVKN